ncbi:hypothetical protein QE152_g40209 [Popillia japonica]|uniref:Polyprotein n=1 Tax=Popillia japonica TaxID=7064 RepID=A0AAW1HSG7_POPJA
MASESSINIEKLKGSENYHTWRFAMENVLDFCGLDKCDNTPEGIWVGSKVDLSNENEEDPNDASNVPERMVTQPTEVHDERNVPERNVRRSSRIPKIKKSDDFIYVASATIYVDDLLIFWKDINDRDNLKKALSEAFHMKDIGKAKHCIGLNITYDEEIKAIYAVNDVSRFNSNHGKAHWQAVKRIFRYLKGTVNLKLRYDSNKELIGYSDADWASDVDKRRSCTGYVFAMSEIFERNNWASDVDKRRSCTGYVFAMSGGAISWSSKRQPTVALSAAEAEYMPDMYSQ